MKWIFVADGWKLLLMPPSCESQSVLMLPSSAPMWPQQTILLCGYWSKWNQIVILIIVTQEAISSKNFADWKANTIVWLFVLPFISESQMDFIRKLCFISFIWWSSCTVSSCCSFPPTGINPQPLSSMCLFTHFFFQIPVPPSPPFSLHPSELEKKREAKQREREAREKEARKREKAEEKEKRRKEYNAQVAAAAAKEQQRRKNEEKKRRNGQAAAGGSKISCRAPPLEEWLKHCS